MSERPTPIMKCLRCRKHKAAPLHYLCPKCHAEQNGEPENPGEKILRLERKLAEARESLDFQIKLNREIIDREAKLLAELAEAKEQRHRLAERIESLRTLCTTDHESKAAFIDRVNAILYPQNTPDKPPP